MPLRIEPTGNQDSDMKRPDFTVASMKTSCVICDLS